VARRQEMAIRAALGSGRGRLLRQLLTENLLLSSAAALFGVALAVGAVHWFRSYNPIELPPATVVQLDGRILTFTILLSIVNIILFGLAPAWKLSRSDLNSALKASGRTLSQDAGSQRFGSFLIVAEVALTLVLLACAGLLIQSVERFASAPVGFQRDGLISARIQLPQGPYGKPETRLRYYDDLLGQLRGATGIAGEALSTVLPLNGTGPVAVLAVKGQPEPDAGKVLDVGTQTVSPEYFRVMAIPLKRGRSFEDRDGMDNETVAVINEALADRYFPKEDPIGRYVRQFEGPATKARGCASSEWWRAKGAPPSRVR